MPIQVSVRGLDSAREILGILQRLPTVPLAARFEGPLRDDGLSNAELLDYLADGKRDVRPNQGDSDAAAKEFASRVEDRLRVSASRALRKAKASGPEAPTARQALALVRRLEGAEQAEAQARAASVSGLKAAVRVLADIMRERVERQKTNAGLDARRVTEDYAEWRQRKFKIAPDVVFRASGQLIRALTEGVVKLVGRGR